MQNATLIMSSVYANNVSQMFTIFGLIFLVSLVLGILYFVVAHILEMKCPECGQPMEDSGYNHDGGPVYYCMNPECPVVDNLGARKPKKGKK